MNYAHFIKLQEYEMAYVLSWGAITLPINMKHLNASAHTYVINVTVQLSAHSNIPMNINKQNNSMKRERSELKKQDRARGDDVGSCNSKCEFGWTYLYRQTYFIRFIR